MSFFAYESLLKFCLRISIPINRPLQRPYLMSVRMHSSFQNAHLPIPSLFTRKSNFQKLHFGFNSRSHYLLNNVIVAPIIGVGSSSCFHTDEDRTTATILNKEEGAPLMVDTYSESGFRLNNGLAVVGSIALFPKSLLSWGVASSEEITEESLTLFYMLAPKIDLLILGIGDAGSQFNMHLLPFMRNKGVSLEVLPTSKAVSTFNFLTNEGRSVAGAFIPPRTVLALDEDYAENLQRKREMFEATIPDEFL